MDSSHRSAIMPFATDHWQWEETATGESTLVSCFLL